MLKNAIALVQQKNPNNLDILAFWLANTSRLLHDMKQYSGDRVSIRGTIGYILTESPAAAVQAISKLRFFNLAQLPNLSDVLGLS